MQVLSYTGSTHLLRTRFHAFDIPGIRMGQNTNRQRLPLCHVPRVSVYFDECRQCSDESGTIKELKLGIPYNRRTYHGAPSAS